MDKLPRELFQQIQQIDRIATPETVKQVTSLFKPYHEANGYQAPRVERDLSYGGDDRHRLDVHLPEAATDLPVLLYVPGGGFIGGDKSLPGTPYYDHIGAWAVRNGMVAAIMNYRLAPQHPWPAGAQDVAAAVAWIRESIAEYGGDPRRIVVFGASAGASHVAGFLAGHGGPGADELVGAVMLSGIYDPATAEQNMMSHAYFGDKPDEQAQRSALPGLVSSTVPLLFGVAELDLPDFHQQGVVLLDAMLAANKTIPPLISVLGHGHFSQVFSFGLDDEALGAALARFVHHTPPADSGVSTL